MHGRSLMKVLTLLLLIGIGHAGLVHRRDIKEIHEPIVEVEKVGRSGLAPPRLDQIPVTIIQDPQQDLNSIAPAASASLPEREAESESEPTKLPLEGTAQEQERPASVVSPDSEIQKLNPSPNEELLDNNSAATTLQTDSSITERLEAQAEALTENLLGIQQSGDLPTKSLPGQSVLSESTSQSDLSDSQPETLVPLGGTNIVKALPGADSQSNVVVEDENTAPEVVASQQDDLQRQVTQPTPTETSTPQNFVQQLIQNSPIGQFLSQFTGGQQQQQQQQQGQTQADEPATPAPTLPGFLNPALAITSAQQAVQNAAQSVVNTTTQAFQGLQQFATNLGTQFQNTFSTLAGQQNQLSTADSTTTRPPGPIQSIVSSFVNPGNNQAGEGATAATGQQQQGPLQGILSFFQGGIRPQSGVSTAPPKEEPVTPAGVDDKIESEPNDPIVDSLPDQQEPDAANEVRSSAEVTNEDNSFEEVANEDIIVVNDDATQQDTTV